ncbi:hypothetical protein CsSME_00052392 [Camellia sinensis var. sinensis]
MGYSLINRIWTKTKKTGSSLVLSTPGSFLPSPILPFSTLGPSTPPSPSNLSSFSQKIEHLDFMVQGPLLDGIASMNSRLNNLNLDSQSILASDIPSSSLYVSASSSSALEQNMDKLASLSTRSRTPMKNSEKSSNNAGTMI